MVEFKITYNHAEAYCHMHYECRAGHITEIWNRRDGVTPFMVQCLHPDCEEIAQHVRWNEDLVDPIYQLQPGDWYFRNGTDQDAERILRYRFEGRPLDVDRLVKYCATSLDDFIRMLIQDPHGEFTPGWPYLDRVPIINNSSANTD
jgi:hypothetical protein